MKKLSFLVALFLGASSAFAAQDTVSMVTYFPMPYVSYNNLTVTKQLDVGLGTQCKWEMGNDSAATCPLTATTVNLWGTLRLRNFTRLTQTTGTTLGNTTSNTGAQLKFQNNLRIHSFENAPMASVHTENLIVSGYDKLSVYSGRVSNPTYVMNQCTEGVHWEEITGKDNKSGVYLVCGQSTVPSCEGPSSRSCGCGNKGTQTRTCDTSTGEWGEWGTCVGAPEIPAQKIETQSCSFSKSYEQRFGVTANGGGAVFNTGTVYGKKSRTFNETTCSWEAWSPCEADILMRVGFFGGPGHEDSAYVCFQPTHPKCPSPIYEHEACDWPQSPGPYPRTYCVAMGVYGSNSCSTFQCQRIRED